MEHKLNEGETHPMASDALAYCKVMMDTKPFMIEAIASSSMAGNRAAEICQSTINRLISGTSVSDRYVLGLAFMFVTLERDEGEE